MNWAVLINSLLLAGGTTVTACLAGLVAALAFASFAPRWRSWLTGAAIGILAMPPFLSINCHLDLFGNTGAWRACAPCSIYGPAGALWMLTLAYWPLAALATWTAWRRLPGECFEADPCLHGAMLVRWILIPTALRPLFHAGLIIFILAFNNFAIPAILQVKVFPAEVWLAFSTQFNYSEVIRLSWPCLLVLGLLLALAPKEPPHGWRYAGWKTFDLRRPLGTVWSAGPRILLAVLLFFSLMLPLGHLMLQGSSWIKLAEALRTDFPVMVNSALIPAATATTACLIGLAISKIRPGWAGWLPFALPGILLGIAAIGLFNRPALGWIYATFLVVVIVWVFRYLVFARTALAWARRHLDPQLNDAALVDGATPSQRFLHVQWPQMQPLAAVGWYVVYLLCLWDVETLILVVPPGGDTLSLRIFNLLHYGHNDQVDALCLALLFIALMPLLIYHLSVCMIDITQRTHRSPIRGCTERQNRQKTTRAWHTVAVMLLGCLLMGAGCRPDSPSLEAPLHSRLFDRAICIGTRGTGLGEFNKPRSVVVDREDNIYVVDMTGRVQKFSSSGQFLDFWQMEQTDKGKPKGMGCDASGNIIVVEPHYSRVNHYAPDAHLILQWGVNGTNGGQLAFPRAIVVNSKGHLLLSEYGVVERVQEFDATGREWIRSFGEPGGGPGQFNRPEGLDVDARDRVFVADSCNHRIQIFSHDGRFESSFGQPGSQPGQLSYPYDVRVDSSGCLFVCEFGNSRIQVFDERHASIEMMGGPGQELDRLNNPWSIALDSKGNLLVADAGNHRVLKYQRRQGTLTRPPSVPVSPHATP